MPVAIALVEVLRVVGGRMNVVAPPLLGILPSSDSAEIRTSLLYLVF